jgi:hypothetical protein
MHLILHIDLALYFRFRICKPQFYFVVFFVSFSDPDLSQNLEWLKNSFNGKLDSSWTAGIDLDCKFIYGLFTHYEAIAFSCVTHCINMLFNP